METVWGIEPPISVLKSSSFKQPTSDMNVASGCPQFTRLVVLDNNSYQDAMVFCVYIPHNLNGDGMGYRAHLSLFFVLMH